jgi:membrane protease YdiL (CAAX protease family)
MGSVMTNIDFIAQKLFAVNKENLSTRLKLLCVVLITLQSYLVPITSYIMSKSDDSSYAAYMQFYAISSYTVIILGLIVLDANGVKLFQDYLTLLMIVLSCFFRSDLGGEYDTIYRNYMNFLGISLLIYIFYLQRRITVPNLKSLVVAILWSGITILVSAFLYAIIEPVHGTLPANLINYTINMLLFQFSFVTVIEEAIFRGLLFGFMVLSGFGENKALLVQAILFWGIHYMSVSNPLLFFLFVPLYTISITLIVKRYKLLYMSILMHTLVNVFARVLVAIL